MKRCVNVGWTAGRDFILRVCVKPLKQSLMAKTCVQLETHAGMCDQKGGVFKGRRGPPGCVFGPLLRSLTEL